MISRLKNAAALRTLSEKAGLSVHALMVEAQRAVQNILSGDHKQKKPGAGERFWQFREYDPSDRPQDIDWRQTAKSDQVYVREKEKQNAQNIVFWCAGNPSMDFRYQDNAYTKGDIAKIFSLSMAILMTRAHETVQLIGGDFRPGRTEKTLQLFAEEIMRQKNKTLYTFGIEDIPKNATLVMVGDFLEDEDDIKRKISDISGKVARGIMIQVLDPAEIELPYQGRAIFENPVTGEKEVIDNVTPIRERYQERIQNHITGISDLCKRHGWIYLLHSTDMDMSSSLFSAWNKLSGEGARPR